MNITINQKEASLKAQQMLKMFELSADAIEVINQIILPMKGEIIESAFWDQVIIELQKKVSIISVAKPEWKSFTQPINGFSVNVVENVLMEKGKGMMMLHPEDYKMYMNKLKGHEVNKAD